MNRKRSQLTSLKFFFKLIGVLIKEKIQRIKSQVTDKKYFPWNWRIRKQNPVLINMQQILKQKQLNKNLCHNLVLDSLVIFLKYFNRPPVFSTGLVFVLHTIHIYSKYNCDMH